MLTMYYNTTNIEKQALFEIFFNYIANTLFTKLCSSEVLIEN